MNEIDLTPFEQEIISDTRATVLTIIKDPEFGSVIRAIIEGEKCCFIDGNLVEDSELEKKINDKYSNKRSHIIMEK